MVGDRIPERIPEPCILTIMEENRSNWGRSSAHLSVLEACTLAHVVRMVETKTLANKVPMGMQLGRLAEDNRHRLRHEPTCGAVQSRYYSEVWLQQKLQDLHSESPNPSSVLGVFCS